MSYMLQHLHNGWQVDQAILSEEDRVVVIRFGHDWDPTCMVMDETLYKCADKMKNFAVVYLVDITEVRDFCLIGFYQYNKRRSNWLMIILKEVLEEYNSILSDFTRSIFTFRAKWAQRFIILLS